MDWWKPWMMFNAQKEPSILKPLKFGNYTSWKNSVTGVKRYMMWLCSKGFNGSKGHSQGRELNAWLVWQPWYANCLYKLVQYPIQHSQQLHGSESPSNDLAIAWWCWRTSNVLLD